MVVHLQLRVVDSGMGKTRIPARKTQHLWPRNRLSVFILSQSEQITEYPIISETIAPFSKLISVTY
jgi:hypothetical protein